MRKTNGAKEDHMDRQFELPLPKLEKGIYFDKSN
jgi:hypothetical protein